MAPPAQPPAQAGLSNTFQAPAEPSIPAAQLQAIILRLTHAIHDIDSFQNLLAVGAQNGSMPTWDTILERYSLLLSRIQTLSAYLSRPPPAPANPHPTDIPSKEPLLSQFLVHPLNPLASVEQGVNPIAHDIFEWVLSTLPNPALASSQAALISPVNGSSDRDDETTDGVGWTSLDELKDMSEAQLIRIDKQLRGRVSREHYKAQAIREEIDAKDQEMDWEMRILDEVGAADHGEDAAGTNGDNGLGKTSRARDPQEEWSLVDYLKLIDTGRIPLPGGSRGP